jgi:hypothetical protein
VALSILRNPRSPALSNDPNWAVLQSSIAGGVTRPGFLIDGYGGDGDVLNLRWGNTVVNLAFVNDPDDSGTQLRAATGLSAEDERAQLLEALSSVPAIESDFILTLRDDGVRLVLRDTLNGDLQAGSSPSLTLTVFGAEGDPEYPNHVAMVSVYRVGQDAPVARLRAGFDAAGVTEIDFAGLLDEPLGMPPGWSLGNLQTYQAWQPVGMVEYFFRYADAYGRPPQPETLAKSGTFAVVSGGSEGRSVYRWGTVGNFQLCHAYLRQDDTYFAKPVTLNQPDWCYFYSDGSGSVTPWVTVFYQDGTTEEYQVSGSQGTGRGLYAFPCGPVHVSLDTAPSWGTKTAVRYRFELRGSDMVINYQLLPDCQPWEVFLAFENGAGGIESVAFTGKHEEGYRGGGQSFRRARTRVQTSAEGAASTYNAEGQRAMRLRSGYLERDYVHHLRQLLVGRVWLCDMTRRQFVAVNVTDSNLTLSEDDNDLHAVEVSIITATPDLNAHRL